MVVRGRYDLAGMRADADYLLWCTRNVEALQAATRTCAAYRARAGQRAGVDQVALHLPPSSTRATCGLRGRREPRDDTVRTR